MLAKVSLLYQKNKQKLMLISENCLIRMPITKHINELEFFFMFLEAKKFVQNYIFFLVRILAHYVAIGAKSYI